MYGRIISVLFSVLLVSCSAKETYNVRIIPQPAEMEVLPGKVQLAGKGVRVKAPDSVRTEVFRILSDSGLGIDLSSSRGMEISVCDSLSSGMLSGEAYEIDSSDGKVTVSATSVSGVFNAVKTLEQSLLPDGSVPAMKIADEPRFRYRGFMLDISRHFYGKDFIIKQIEALSRYKINVLHLHLTDAAGWRLEIPDFPGLTETAAWRTEARWKNWWNGGRNYSMEGSDGAYGGYLTADDVREIVSYAADRNMTVIPEIEMPSHSDEVLAVYPELSCSGKPYVNSDFCVGNDSTYVFIEKVLSYVMELFPSEYIHIGGDEASKEAWKVCPECRRLMEDKNMSSVDELQSYFVGRVEKFIASKGRRMIGWDEIMDDDAHFSDSAVVMSWRGEDGAVAAVKSGRDAVLSPGAYCYFDAYQDAPHTLPEAMSGYLPLMKVYSYEPLSGVDLTDGQMSGILGVQANLWTEYVPDEEHAEFMMYPRIMAISEIGWTPSEKKDPESFRTAASREVTWLDSMGYNPFDISLEYGERPESFRKVDHLALGASVTYNAPYCPRYVAGGDTALVDGIRGGWTYADGRWQGFISPERLDVTVDLGQSRSVSYVGMDFMQICAPGVFFPASFEVSFSEDNVSFRAVHEEKLDVIKDDQVKFTTLCWEGSDNARYIRIRARSGAFGGYIFTDEIVVK